jgi:1-acyl-sn-glycerol-3-phosphate acyltransferase
MLVKKLGIPRLWNDDPEILWPYIRMLAAPWTMFIVPGSVAYGVDRIPLTGGAVLAANHLSAIDHTLIGIHGTRTMYFMAKAELLAWPVVGELLMWTGAFPVRRGEGDREALREARRLAREGYVVAVHVEGTRQRFGYPGEVKIGGMMIAVQEGVPVIPCAVDTFQASLRHPRRCAVVFGETISLEGLPRKRAGYEEAAAIVGAEIFRLWRQAAEAVVAGLPPALPDGARRSTVFQPLIQDSPPYG